ncbi:MAG: DUF3450 domain-containing protein [Bdellovibrionales bacterium]|nr:DUF3450 domain-containing protein [Bdellovibrionales bacterium]
MNLISFGLTVLLAVSPFFLSAKESSQTTEWLSLFSIKSLYASNSENQLNKVIAEQIKNHQKGARSQEKISSLAEETGDLVSEYEITLRQIESTRTYNEQIRKLILDQNQEMKSIRTQIVEVKKTGKDIVPLMLEMVKNLEQFISLDIPFLMEERKKRLEEIKKIMDRADISISEKYRRLMEAYQIETEYGRTLEAYQGIKAIKGKKLSVNYLRVGRIALLYQTSDGKKQGYWKQSQKKWETLSSRYSRAVEKGLKIARNQQPPDLLTLPIPAPVKTAIVIAEDNNLSSPPEEETNGSERKEADSTVEDTEKVSETEVKKGSPAIQKDDQLEKESASPVKKEDDE